jgi:hypothetical protein
VFQTIGDWCSGIANVATLFSSIAAAVILWLQRKREEKNEMDLAALLVEVNQHQVRLDNIDTRFSDIESAQTHGNPATEPPRGGAREGE